MIEDICSNRHGGNEESIQANLRAQPSKEKGRTMILDYLQERGSAGATCDHIEFVLLMRHQTASARCSELLRDGAIVRKRTQSGEKVRQPTRTGAKAAVLILKKFQPAISKFDENGQADMFAEPNGGCETFA